MKLPAKSLKREAGKTDLPRLGASCKKAAMKMRPSSTAHTASGIAGETLRALASTLLLLGLIGDRRVR